MLPGDADAADTPAPGDYHPLQECPRGPAWTLAGKTPTAAGTAGSRALCDASVAGGAAEEPGPGAYFVPEGVYRTLAVGLYLAVRRLVASPMMGIGSLQ